MRKECGLIYSDIHGPISRELATLDGILFKILSSSRLASVTTDSVGVCLCVCVCVCAYTIGAAITDML